MTNTVPTDRPLSTLEYVPNIRVHYIRGNIALGGIAYIRHTGIEAVSSMGQKLLGGQNPSRKKKDRPVQGKNIPSPKGPAAYLRPGLVTKTVYTYSPY
jgi:hypothetical protein